MKPSFSLFLLMKNLGFNFNGLSCGSCKSFFRRNITKYESFICSRDNDCIITLYSRKCCTRCRLTKCIEIGMRKELISFREECPPEQMLLTAINSNTTSNSTNKINISKTQHLKTNFNLEHILTYNDSCDSYHQCQNQQQPYYSGYFTQNSQSPNSYYHHQSMSEVPIMEMNTQVPELTNSAYKNGDLLLLSDSVPVQNTTAISSPLVHQPIPTTSTTTTTTTTTVDHPLGRADATKKYELNFIELHYIAQIVRASAAAFKDEDSVPIVADATDVVYILNLAEYYIKRTIKFSKALAAFMVLCQDDQLALLKAFFTELLILRLGFFYQADTDGYLAIMDSVASSANSVSSQAIFIRLNTLFGKANKLHQATFIRHYVISYQQIVDKDSTLRDLIITTLLFKSRLQSGHPHQSSPSATPPELDHDSTSFSNDHGHLVSCPEYMRYQYYLHNRLLERYCEAKYCSSKRAREKLRSVEQLLSGIDQIKNIIEGLFIDADESQISLVLNEIYRVKKESH